MITSFPSFSRKLQAERQFVLFLIFFPGPRCISWLIKVVADFPFSRYRYGCKLPRIGRKRVSSCYQTVTAEYCLSTEGQHWQPTTETNPTQPAGPGSMVIDSLSDRWSIPGKQRRGRRTRPSVCVRIRFHRIQIDFNYTVKAPAIAPGSCFTAPPNHPQPAFHGWKPFLCPAVSSGWNEPELEIAR